MTKKILELTPNEEAMINQSDSGLVIREYVTPQVLVNVAAMLQKKKKKGVTSAWTNLCQQTGTKRASSWG